MKKNVFMLLALSIILIVIVAAVIDLKVNFTGKTIAARCTDSDANDPNYPAPYIQGIVTITDQGKIIDQEMDTCIDNDNVREYHCAGFWSLYIGSTTYTCPYRDYCENGRCKYVNYCSDSDGGKNIYTAGSVKERFEGVWINSHSDTCASSTSVKEWYCPATNTIPQSIVISCPSGYKCMYRKCIEI